MPLRQCPTTKIGGSEMVVREIFLPKKSHCTKTNRLTIMETKKMMVAIAQRKMWMRKRFLASSRRYGTVSIPCQNRAPALEYFVFGSLDVTGGAGLSC